MELNKEIIKGHVESIILSLLQEKDLYGYEISKLIRENSKEAFEVKDGTLYVVLKRLEKLGLVISYWGDCKSGGGRRKYFKIKCGIYFNSIIIIFDTLFKFFNCFTFFI